LLAAEHGLAADLKGRLAPLAAKRKPWEQILRRSGRTP
jgi:hypothetical protein